MRRLTLILTMVVLSTAIYGQEFLGIKPSGNKDYTINQFKAKGFKVTDTFDKGVFMSGTVNDQILEMIIFTTPKTNQVVKFVVYLPEQTTWATLKSNFFRYTNLFTAKYGKPYFESEKFLSIYKEGDGYEMTAVKSENTKYSYFWQYNGYSLGVSISEYAQIKIIYENDANQAIFEQEVAQSELKNF